VEEEDETMYGASRLSPIGCAFYPFVGISILMLMFTWLTFRVWRVETAGVCATGRIVGISHCRGRDNKELATANLDVAFTDTGAQQAAKAASAALRTRAFYSAGRRNPGSKLNPALSHRVRRALSRSRRPVG
jgi:hypothetical protein